MLHSFANFDAGHSPSGPPARRRTSRALCPQSAHLHSKRSDARGVPNANAVLLTAMKKPSHLGHRPANGFALSLTVSVFMAKAVLVHCVFDDDQCHIDEIARIGGQRRDSPVTATRIGRLNCHPAFRSARCASEHTAHDSYASMASAVTVVRQKRRLSSAPAARECLGFGGDSRPCGTEHPKNFRSLAGRHTRGKNAASSKCHTRRKGSRDGRLGTLCGLLETARPDD
jgi:hypothetical protein